METLTPPLPPEAREVLDFWFGDGLDKDWPSTDHKDLWFGGGAEQDQQIRDRFGSMVDGAQAGGLTDWEGDLLARLALVILLDQFSRNVYRGQARAFAADARAQQLVLRTLADGQDESLARVGRVFLYMPLMHAEDLALQDRCVERFTALHAGSPPELRDRLAGNLRFAQTHRDIIAAHGRFPYRNAVLGRNNTPEEQAFLKDGPRFGQ
jgi:uncharacterized protein (DUF924 family)